jgi:hypothetical protein
MPAIMGDKWLPKRQPEGHRKGAEVMDLHSKRQQRLQGQKQKPVLSERYPLDTCIEAFTLETRI